MRSPFAHVALLCILTACSAAGDESEDPSELPGTISADGGAGESDAGGAIEPDGGSDREDGGSTDASPSGSPEVFYADSVWNSALPDSAPVHDQSDEIVSWLRSTNGRDG